MIHLECDYTEGAHQEILEELLRSNMEQTTGYGCDEYCQAARDLIKKECQAPDADVHFLVGGTQTNATVILSALRSYQGVLSADTGHINVHETGAVEWDGHKVLALPSVDGKITADQVKKAYEDHKLYGLDHMVMPKMVYISQPTELGTMYTLAELEAISKVCKESGFYFFIDGARLGYGLAAEGNDVFLPDLARLSDVFYLGGTKLGALFGEAVVITREELKPDFRYLIKQKGAMLAKGRLLGLQFKTLLEERDIPEKNLYMKGSVHAIKLADKLRSAMKECQVPFLVENNTNQLFIILPDKALEELDKKYVTSYQERVDESHSAVRVCTSWATKEAYIDSFIEDLSKALQQKLGTANKCRL